MTATVLPKDATNKKVAFSTSDPKVAAVSVTGEVTGISVGEAVITAKTDDGGKTATSAITVTEK